MAARQGQDKYFLLYNIAEGEYRYTSPTRQRSQDRVKSAVINLGRSRGWRPKTRFLDAFQYA